MRKTALDACVLLLRPIASVLLRFGITWKEFSEISKRVFVEVATKEYGIKGRPTNASRVEILTGVNRREVMRLRKSSFEVDTESLKKHNLVAMLIGGWRKDPDFCDDNMQPLMLEKEGSFPSFKDLIKKYGNDISAPTVLKELLNTNSIKKHESGKLELIKKYFIPLDEGDRVLQTFCISLSDLANTLSYTFWNREKKQVRYGGYADEKIPVDLAEEFTKYVYVKNHLLLEEIDSWLVSHKTEDKDVETVRLGVGVYMIHDEERYK